MLLPLTSFRAPSLFDRAMYLSDLMRWDLERQFTRALDPFEDFYHYPRRPSSLSLLRPSLFSGFERQIDQAFRTLEELDKLSVDDLEKVTPPAIEKDDNTTYYKVVMKTNKDGNVKVKTMEKEPGSEWKIETKEYKKGEKAIEEEKEKKVEEAPQAPKQVKDEVEIVEEKVGEKPKSLEGSA